MGVWPGCFATRLLQKEHRTCQLSSALLWNPRAHLCRCYQTRGRATDVSREGESGGVSSASKKALAAATLGLSSGPFAKAPPDASQPAGCRNMKQEAPRLAAPSRGLPLVRAARDADYSLALTRHFLGWLVPAGSTWSLSSLAPLAMQGDLSDSEQVTSKA